MDEGVAIRRVDNEVVLLPVIAQEVKGAAHLQPSIEVFLLRRWFRYAVQAIHDGGRTSVSHFFKSIAKSHVRIRSHYGATVLFLC